MTLVDPFQLSFLLTLSKLGSFILRNFAQLENVFFVLEYQLSFKVF